MASNNVLRGSGGGGKGGGSPRQAVEDPDTLHSVQYAQAAAWAAQQVRNSLGFLMPTLSKST